tara:strand:- start:10559 stop:11260 length:702 start_codon:yes stop_codon:yes gene_type:complete
MNKFSIVIPVYNEAKNLRILIPRIYQELKNKEFELIIVDDNSTDNTSKLLKKCKKKNFYYIIRKSNRDLSKSCVLGFKKSKYKNIIVMDGDLQHKPSDIKKFLYVFLIKNPDIVVGTRNLFKYKKHNLNAFRLFASRALILIVNLLLENKTSDPMSGFFMFKKEIFLKSEKKLINRGYKILLDLLYISNQKIKVYDVSIDFDSRIKGKSKMSMKILIYLIFMIFRKFISRILS